MAKDNIVHGYYEYDVFFIERSTKRDNLPGKIKMLPSMQAMT